MLEFIIKYWVQAALTIITGAIGVLFRNGWKWKTERDLVKLGVLSLLHDRLYRACRYQLELGYCDIEDRDNLEYLYRPYRALGGNGTGEELYKRCMALPYRLEDKNE